MYRRLTRLKHTSSHQESAGTGPIGTPPPAQPPPTTTDTGNTVPQSANPTQRVYTHLCSPPKEGPGPGWWVGGWGKGGYSHRNNPISPLFM